MSTIISLSSRSTGERTAALAQKQPMPSAAYGKPRRRYALLGGFVLFALCVIVVPEERALAQQFLSPIEQTKEVSFGPRFFAGIVGGFTASSPSKDVNAILNGQDGWIAGLQFSYRAFKIATLHAEVVVKEKGLTYSFNDLLDTATFDHDSHQITQLDIPISVQIPLLDGPIQPYISFGPSIGFLLSARYTLTRDITSTSFSDKITSYAPIEYTFNIGAGSIFMLDDKLSITADVQYSTSLLNPYPQDRRDNGQSAPDVWKITLGLLRSF